MEVNVQSEGGLIIRYTGSGDGWGVVASAKQEGNPINLEPASTADMLTWSTATAASPGSHEMNESTIKPVTVAADAKNITNNKYVVKHTFEIRATNASADTKGLYIKSATVTANQQVNKALRIGIIASGTGVAADGGKFILAPVRVGDTLPTNDYKVYTATGAGPTYTATEVTDVVHWVDVGDDARILGDDVSVPASSDSDVITVAIYIWFEGEEEALFSDNVHAAESLKISLDFTTDTLTPISTGTGA